MMRICLSLLVLALTGCAGITAPTPIKEAEAPQKVTLQEAAFSALPHWPPTDAQAAGAGRALGTSCKKFLSKEADNNLLATPNGAWAGTYRDWKALCQNFITMSAPNGASLQKFFEDNFMPHLVQNGGAAEGLFTGYYVPLLKASQTKSETFSYPIYAKPNDLISVDLGLFKDEWKGKKLAGQLQETALVPYPDRKQIDDTGLNKAKILAYTNDPVGLFFLHIQGSGLLEFDDGKRMGIGYDGQNGHAYTAIGKVLLDRGELEKGNVTMQSLKAWLATNQNKAVEIMHANRSYIFFRTLAGEGVIGAEGTVLTPHHSLAVDKSLIPFGVPLWVDIEHPKKDSTRINNLMLAQDTGGAIKGAVRGDYFWGSGNEAEHYAGVMQSKGRYWVLLPKALAR